MLNETMSCQGLSCTTHQSHPSRHFQAHLERKYFLTLPPSCLRKYSWTKKQAGFCYELLSLLQLFVTLLIYGSTSHAQA